MRLNKHIFSSTLLFVASLALIQAASAGPFLLTSMPSKCISLNEGLVCYQDIQIKWQAPDLGNFCLVQVESNRALKCWIQQRAGQYAFEFAEKQAQVYALRRQGENENLASARIDVRWVYKSKRRDRLRWKVF
jgi:hypothetical protein